MFVNGTAIHKFRAKGSEIVAAPLYLANNSRDRSPENMKKTGFNSYVYDFSVDYDAITVGRNIHNYLMKKNDIVNEMFGFVKKSFFAGLTNLSILTEVNSLSCISMNNQECKTRQQIVNVNSDVPVFFPFSIKASKCSGSCNNINDPYAKVCVPRVVKTLNVKVFNLMSRTNETRHLKSHKTYKCKCRLHASVSNNKQRWNDDKCRCERKELINKGMCDKGFIWNHSNCECECDKLYDIGEYLDNESCNCRKKTVDKLVEECTKAVEEVKIDKITLAEDKNKHKCSPCTLHIVLFSILFRVNVGIVICFIYFHWYLKKDVTRVELGTRTQTTI